MLTTLDTVIAFAVIMTVLSLLITLVVQMVSAALSLRGKNLANALALTFQTIDRISASMRIPWRRKFYAIRFLATLLAEKDAAKSRRGLTEVHCSSEKAS